ncbi:hypothetical protein DFH29DRAFT_807528, partial [Suillus ampliporus]
KNPAFGPAQSCALTGIFFSRSINVSSVYIWSTMTVASEDTAGIDVIPWLSRMMLDVIGLAGFNYEFDALNANEGPNELNQAFSVIFSATRKMSVLPMLKTWIPLLRWIVSSPLRRDRRFHGDLPCVDVPQPQLHFR